MPVKTIFNDQGQTVQIIRIDEEQLSDTLAPGVYTLEMSMNGPYLYKVADRYQVPSRVYGKAQTNAQRAIKAFEEREQSTGVLLSGLKGAGKTMTATLMGNMVIDLGLPVIEVKSAIDPEVVEYVLTAVGKCAALIDEFGKLYNLKKNDSDKDDNNKDSGRVASLLSLFAGTTTSKRLMILTENNLAQINSFMLDRPGRVLYHFRHNSLDPEVIEGIGRDKNVPGSFIDDVVNACFMSPSASFDVINAVYDEYLRTPGTFTEVVQGMNVPMSSDTYRYAKLLSSKLEFTSCNKTMEFDTTGCISEPYITIKNGVFEVPAAAKNCVALSSQIKVFVENACSAGDGDEDDHWIPTHYDLSRMVGERYHSTNVVCREGTIVTYTKDSKTVQLEIMPPEWLPPRVAAGVY